jgi:hypothetical protein
MAAVAAGIVGIVCLAALVAASLALLLAQRTRARVHTTLTAVTPSEPSRFAHAYILHSAHRTDRDDIVTALTQVARAAGTPEPHVHVFPATYLHADDAAAQAFRDCAEQRMRNMPPTWSCASTPLRIMCGRSGATPRGIRAGEFGCTASHKAALQHALTAQPSLASPRTNDWVLIFEDDATLHPGVGGGAAADDATAALMQQAIGAAARAGIDAVFFGWRFHRPTPRMTRVAARLWRASSAPFLAHAYAVRGSLIPTLLQLLERYHCILPVDEVYSLLLHEVLIATPDVVAHKQPPKTMLFVQHRPDGWHSDTMDPPEAARFDS